MDIEWLHRIAVRQRGLFTRDQARECGFSADQIQRRLRNRSWQQVWGPVFAFAGLATTQAVRDRAVQLGVPGSVLAGPSAARLWELEVDSWTTYLATPRRLRNAVGVRLLHQPVAQLDRVLFHGVPVTSRERTIFDCLYLLPEDDALDLLDRALQQRWTTVPDVAQRCTAFVGRRGVPQVVRLMRQAVGGSRFAAERRCARLLDRAGITGWQVNAAIHGAGGATYIGDVVFRQARLIVEIDGWAFHTTPERFQADRARQNRLIVDGWTVLRFTWRDLTERADYVIRTIRSLISARRWIAA
jgi:very-short-patch-repair endonuclease